MKSVSPDVYTKEYYLKTCLGSEEFSKTKGTSLHPRLTKLVDSLDLKPTMSVLDIGCGRGDIAMYVARKTKYVVGVDYAKAAITLAQKTKKHFPLSLQKKAIFSQMDIKKLEFNDNSFDLVIAIDVFEHLYKEELEVALREIKRVLKPGGILFVHTGTNKILYNYTYPLYVYNVNRLLTTIDQKIRKVKYPLLPKDPRTITEKEQHVNEPTYFYLKDLFDRFKFEGRIKTEIGYIKEGKSLKTKIYNFFITLYPLSMIPPLSLLFGWVFICQMKNDK